MREAILNTAKDWMVLALTGLGINFAPHQFWGGMFLALGAAMAARHIRPEKDHREIWFVMLTACIAAILAAEIAQIWAPGWPSQLVMATAGFFSRFAVEMTINIAMRLQSRTDLIADKLLDKVLPDDDGKGGS
jgi:uncharacterized protein involved in response to NO